MSFRRVQGNTYKNASLPILHIYVQRNEGQGDSCHPGPIIHVQTRQNSFTLVNAIETLPSKNLSPTELGQHLFRQIKSIHTHSIINSDLLRNPRDPPRLSTDFWDSFDLTRLVANHELIKTHERLNAMQWTWKIKFIHSYFFYFFLKKKNKKIKHR